VGATPFCAAGLPTPAPAQGDSNAKAVPAAAERRIYFFIPF